VNIAAPTGVGSTVAEREGEDTGVDDGDAA
jgi:hypothetical protein